MRRRTLLTGISASALAAIAGCADWTSTEIIISLESVEVDAVADELTEQATVTDDGLVPSAAVTTLVDRLRNGERVELEPIDLELVEYPQHGPLYHRSEDGIYRIDRTVLAAGSITGPEYEISRINSFPDGVSPDDEDAVLSFADLPPVEQ